MAYAVNQHVDRLTKHLPFGANASELYEERISADGRPAIRTKALEYVLGLVRSPDVSLIVLTGDAGHGKTHLCRRLLEDYGYTAEEALTVLARDPRGELVVRPKVDAGDPRRPLRILRDLSEIEPPELGASRMAALLSDVGSVGVVCANEGRLRDAISRHEDRSLDVLLNTLEQSVSKGSTSVRPDVHVVNLNHQAVTAGDRSFFSRLLREWVEDRRRWTVCRSCDASERCPILANQSALAGDDPNDTRVARRRDALELMVRTVERAGYVLTIREALMLTAFLVTGGLDCLRVAEIDRRRRLPDAQGLTPFVATLFERNLSDSEHGQLPVLQRLRRFDPGVSAIREIDDAILRLLDSEEKERTSAPPRTLRDARNRADEQRERVRRLRREDFFDGRATDDLRSVSLDVRRLGFRHYDDFLFVVSSTDDDAKRSTNVRDQILDGLHVIQGIRPASETHFFVTDPAFARVSGRAPIVARRILRANVRLRPVEQVWGEAAVTRAVDWLQRTIAITFGVPEAFTLTLDLAHFELVMRAGRGIAYRGFHAIELRRILGALAQLARSAAVSDETILIVHGPRVRSLSIDGSDFVVGDP